MAGNQTGNGRIAVIGQVPHDPHSVPVNAGSGPVLPGRTGATLEKFHHGARVLRLFGVFLNLFDFGLPRVGAGPTRQDHVLHEILNFVTGSSPAACR
jgi:hypothetical protein